MEQSFIKPEWISEYPSNIIPKGAKIFAFVDLGHPKGDCTVSGFYDPANGEIHIQNIEWMVGDKEQYRIK